MAQAGTVWVDVRGDTKGFLSDVAGAARRAGSSFSPLNAGKTVLSDLGQVAGVTALAVGGIGAAAVKTSMEFNAGMSAVGAVANASGAELDSLREAALQAGAASVFTATEAAEAQAELARAGVSTADILGGALTGALDLAAAGQVGLADAAEIAAQAMNVFDLAGGDVAHVADVLAAGANKSAADISTLGFALRQGGLQAKQLGVSLEDTIGAFSLFADNALVGSDAGTSFRTMLQRVIPQTEKQAKAMDKLGLSFFDTEGNFVGLEEMAGRLRDALSGMSQEQRSLTLTTIFGSDAVRAANVLYEAGAEGVREYTAAVNDAGAAQRVAAQNLDNLKGDIEEFSGATETALIRLGDLFDGANRSAVQSATGFVDVFNAWAQMPAWKAVQRNIDDISRSSGDLFDSLGDRLSDALAGVSPRDVDRVFGTIRDAVGDTREAIEGLEPVIGGLSLAFGTMAARSVPFLGQLVPAISPITGLLGGLVLGSQAGRDALAELAGKAQELATKIGPQLAGPLSTLADELSDGLAVVLTEVGGAAIDAAEVLGPVLGQAISDLAPVIGDLIETGGELVAEVLPLLANLAGTVIPPAVDVLGAGLSLAADAAALLADNAWILVPALGAVAAVKIAPAITGAARAMAEFNAAISGIAATRGVSQVTALGGVARSTGREVGSLATGLIGSLNPAVLGVTAAITLGSIAYGRYAENKREIRELTDGLVDALDEERGKYLEMSEAQTREIFASGRALGVQNKLGFSLRELTNIAAEHKDGITGLVTTWELWGAEAIRNTELWDQLPPSLRAVAGELRGLVESGQITDDQAIRFLDALDKVATRTGKALRESKEEFESLAREAAASGEIDSTQLERVLKLIRDAKTPDELNAAFQVLGGMLGIVGDEASNAEKELRRLQDRMEEFLGIERDAAEMSRRFNESLDRTTESFFKNGRGIDEHTEAGRANADAIDDMVTSAERFAEQLAKTDQSGRSSAEVMSNLRAQLERLRDQNLINKDEYQELLDLYALTDPEINTRVNVWTDQAKADLEDLRADILDTPGITEPEKAVVRAINDPVALARVGSEIAAVARNRTTTITVDWVNRVQPKTPGNPFIDPSVSGKRIKGGRASGGPVWDGTWLVGEEGPELLHLGPGARGHVTDADTTANVLGGDSAMVADEIRALRDDVKALAGAVRSARPIILQQENHGIDPDAVGEATVRGTVKGLYLSGVG